MPDARALREITDALRALAHRAQDAGSPTLRAVITMTAEAAHREAERARAALADAQQAALGSPRATPGAVD